MENTIATDILIIIGISLITGFLALRAKEPILMGYLLAGIIAGSSALNLIHNHEIINVLAEIGIALLLFHTGIEFSLTRFKKKRNLIIWAPMIQLLITTVLLLGSFLVLSEVLSVDWYAALFMAILFSFSSTSVVAKMLVERKVLNSESSRIMMAWLIIQDLAVIPVSIVLLSLGSESSSLFGTVAFSVLKGGVFLAISLTLIKRFIHWVFKKMAEVNSRELLLMTSLAYSLGMAFLTQWLGISFIFGAFLAGLTLAGTNFYSKVYSEIRSLKDVFTVLFFFSIGALLNIQDVWNNLFAVLVVVVIVVITKFLVIAAITRIFKESTRNSLNVGLGLFQIGEFSFILGGIALNQGLFDQRVYSIVLASAIISIILTPTLIFKGDSLYATLKEFTRKYIKWLYKGLFLYDDRVRKEEDKNNGHVVVCGYGRSGRSIVSTLRDSKLDVIVIDDEESTVSNLKSDKIEAIFGDSTDMEILEQADVESARSIVITMKSFKDTVLTAELARDLNPKIQVIAKSYEDKTREKLEEMGTDLIVEPEFETAKAIVAAVLSKSGKGFKRRIKKMEEER